MKDESNEGESNKKPESLSANNDKEKYLDDADLESLIRESLKHTLNVNKVVRRKKATEKALVNVLSEFMDAFILLGYDTKNKAIEPIFFAKNDMQADALSHYMQSYFISCMRDR